MGLPTSARVTSARTKPAADRLTFFRQSGWLVVATVAAGVFMSAVHTLVSKPMLESEYSVFSALLRVFLLMGFPAGGLQTIFAQQAAAVTGEAEARRLSQATRAVLRGTFLIWLLMAAGVFLERQAILTLLKIVNPAALWVTVVLGLASLWTPILRGLLQGKQDFAGLGWVLILDGVGRFTAIVLIVHWGGQAAGGMMGALIGQTLSLAVAALLVVRILFGPGSQFEWRSWFGRVIPLTFGVGVFLFMSNADVIYVQALFGKDETPLYIPAAMIGLALVTFTNPLASVMFPKIVRSAARTERSDALGQALAATALLGVMAALVCTFFPQLPLRVIYFRTPSFWESAPLVPWFAWALLPLILANVLISNLLARQRFRAVPGLVLVAVAYGLALFGLRENVMLFSASDLRDPAALTRTLESQAGPNAQWIWQRLTPEQRQSLTASKGDVSRNTAELVKDLNFILRQEAFYSPERFDHVKLSATTTRMIETHGGGKVSLRLNRKLLQEAFPSELGPTRAGLLRRFKMVIGTLGLFSFLLLLTALGFTLWRKRPV